MGVENIYELMSDALISANTSHNKSYIDLIRKEIVSSECSKERFFLRKIIKNEKIAFVDGTPLCQDTGILTFYISFPAGFDRFSMLEKKISDAVRDVYIKNDFRDSVRSLCGKKIRGNLPCSFLYFPHQSDELIIRFIVKGGGSENVSGLINLLPSSEREDIEGAIVDHFKEIKDRGCPPYFAGICIGGSMETSVLYSRFALFEVLEGEMNTDEIRLAEKINDIGTGIFGTGYGKTILSLKIRERPFHIASLFVAISICCHQLRIKEVRIKC